MPLSKSLAQYLDVQQTLLAAREAGGAIYRLPTSKQAIQWRLRAYYYRKLLIQKDEEAHSIPGYSGTSDWDDMTLVISADDPTAVRIQFGVVKGKLEGLDGAAIEPARTSGRAAKPIDAVDADLLAMAEQLAVEIDKG